MVVTFLRSTRHSPNGPAPGNKNLEQGQKNKLPSLQHTLRIPLEILDNLRNVPIEFVMANQ